MFFTRTSVLAFYLRIFPQRDFRLRVFLTMGSQTAVFISFTLAVIFQCTPISYFWTGWRGNSQGKCVNIMALVYSSAAFSIFYDVIVIVLPVPEIMKLSTTTKRKMQILSMFGVGILYVWLLASDTLALRSPSSVLPSSASSGSIA
jgi:hypothetical protein